MIVKRKKLKKVVRSLLLVPIALSVFQYPTAQAAYDAPLAQFETNMMKNENVYYIDDLIAENKQYVIVHSPKGAPKTSQFSPAVKEKLKTLIRKQVAAQGGQTVRLVEVKDDGTVSVNENANPNAISIWTLQDFLPKRSQSATSKPKIKKMSLLSEPSAKVTNTATPGGGAMCTPMEYEDYLQKVLKFPSDIYVNGTLQHINIDNTRYYKTVVYGEPFGRYNNGEYENLGYNLVGGEMLNPDFPPDAIGSAPSASQFRTTRNFTGYARNVFEYSDVLTGEMNYNQATRTISQFVKPIWNYAHLTDIGPVNWWLDSSAPRIKLQGLWDSINAGLGVTQYESSSGGAYYQTYMVKPYALPLDCGVDIVAKDTQAVRTDDNGFQVNFSVENGNYNDHVLIESPYEGIPWQIDWHFVGKDGFGKSVEKWGSDSHQTTSNVMMFPSRFEYGYDYSKDYTIHPDIPSDWDGTIQYTATVNPKWTGYVTENNYNNNAITKTIDWKPTLQHDIKANLLRMQRQKNSMKIDFGIKTNNAGGIPVQSKDVIPWMYSWKFTGNDENGNPITADGVIPSNSLDKYDSTLYIDKNYIKSNTTDLGINPKWKGIVTVTAKANPSCGNPNSPTVNESDCSNNTLVATIDWSNLDIGGVTYTCDAPNIIGGVPDIKSNVELSVDYIDAPTTDKGKTATSKVKVQRTDLTGNLDAYRKKLQDNITQAQNAITGMKAEIDTMNNELTTLQSNLETLKMGKQVETCQDDVCVTNVVIDQQAVTDAEKAINDKKLAIFKKDCDVKYKEAEIRGWQNELKEINDLQTNTASVQTQVNFTFNGNDISSQQVNLQSGETKELSFSWTVSDTGNVAAEINKAHEFNEGDYTNNKLATKLYLPSKQVSDLTDPTTTLTGVVATVKERDTIDRTKVNAREEIETLTGSITNMNPTSLRAGYGFTYEVSTSYKNNWDKTFKGTPTKVNAIYSYQAPGISSMKQSLDTKTNDGIAGVFYPAQVYVAKHSGNVFESSKPNSPMYDPSDVLINGGRKWYSPFDLKDGTYDYTVEAAPAGVNQMTLRMKGNINVVGTAMDDFVRRDVMPNQAFKAQPPGYNWKGNESILENLNSWYFSSK